MSRCVSNHIVNTHTYVVNMILLFLLSRKPLDERLRDRDLEAALALSLLNSTNHKKEQAKGHGSSLQNKGEQLFGGAASHLRCVVLFQGLPKSKLWQMKTQIQGLCTSPTAVWT